MDLRASLEQKFAEPVTCYGHCSQPSGFTIVSDQPLIACYHCMPGYASRIMTYGRGEVDVPGFKAFIAKTIGSLGTVQDEDIRVATRHPWDAPDLGGEDVRVTYWTQNYRRTKVDDPGRAALFLCGNCSSFFVQPITGRSALCNNCRPETPPSS